MMTTTPVRLEPLVQTSIRVHTSDLSAPNDDGQYIDVEDHGAEAQIHLTVGGADPNKDRNPITVDLSVAEAQGVIDALQRIVAVVEA